MVEKLRNSMFHRHDDLYFLMEFISDNENLIQIKCTFNEYLEVFGCFEIVPMWSHFKQSLNSSVISSEFAFGDLVLFLIGDGHIKDYHGTSFVKVPRVGFNNTFKQCVSKLEKIVSEDYSGMVSLEELSSQLFGFSQESLLKIIGDYSEVLCVSNIDGTMYVQQYDYLELPDNFPEVVTRVIGKMDDIRLPTNLDYINIAISLELGVSFRSTYGISNDSIFKSIIKRNCLLSPEHFWFYNTFKEADE